MLERFVIANEPITMRVFGIILVRRGFITMVVVLPLDLSRSRNGKFALFSFGILLGFCQGMVLHKHTGFLGLSDQLCV